LLAVANWQFPAVILRSSRHEFPELRNAAQMEWTRVARGHPSKGQSSSLLDPAANSNGRLVGFTSNRW
jgi:hypothetical protein